MNRRTAPRAWIDAGCPGEYGVWIDAHVDALTAEVERLRAALEACGRAGCPAARDTTSAKEPKVADVWATGIEDGNATADLIAAAPAMARALIHRMGDRNCEYCGVKVDRITETNRVDPLYKGETLTLSDPAHHAPTCMLVAVLRQAGVLP